MNPNQSILFAIQKCVIFKSLEAEEKADDNFLELRDVEAGLTFPCAQRFFVYIAMP